MEFVLELQELDAPELDLRGGGGGGSQASLLLCGDSSVSLVTCQD
ncbi:SapB/AmfS family lanthipeptide [Goodfellowiella coeruleoviolacea]|uniref:SapB/AmfS family lantipeptide n=1 Tax=Goodfellowiella coeruleoviolacea TaxID=334858 RepID=A0AAE3KH36_9PSEU|nr:SapB/AmfS family lanthipeptide [Goodfellowiella coeruleoviolacea]MCP2166069.1 hypothetical protein [Goodfellowiella coeruleoviolacea]